MTEDDFDFDAIERDLRGTPSVPMEFTPTALVMLCGQIQLALRHPLNDGPTANWAETFVRTAAAYLPPSAQALIQAGFDETAQTPLQRAADRWSEGQAPIVEQRRYRVDGPHGSGRGYDPGGGD